jgi:thiosulfate reductase cytochrome b subunit
VVHGGLRYFSARRNSHHTGELEEAYMYSVYERLWHWLQMATIALLIFTGLIIHRPAMFGMFSFRGVVLVHNVVAVILLVNAVLAAFYHFASGEIQQFLPRPHGLFDQMFMQARFYLQGIFRNEPHPFEKTPRRKMNPLQQMTYLGLLNVLLPLQIITGILMWGVQRWPDIAARLGGLPLLAPIHTMTAWMFAAFIVAHVYLTTTGPKPLTSIKGMIMGWEEIEPQFETK